MICNLGSWAIGPCWAAYGYRVRPDDGERSWALSSPVGVTSRGQLPSIRVHGKCVIHLNCSEAEENTFCYPVVCVYLLSTRKANYRRGIRRGGRGDTLLVRKRFLFL